MAGHVTINILSDDVLLCIFYFVQFEVDRLRHLTWWHRLAHVCRRWRSIIFASPNSLDLRIICTPWTPAELLGIWPPLPIIITNMLHQHMFYYHSDAAIAHRNRVCEIDLHLASPELQQLGSAMQERFPALVHLKLASSYGGHPILALPDGFLGGSAPRLQSLKLNRIPFPALPNLLLSATDLVSLTLWDIPHSGYISPEVMVTHLAVLTNLESLVIEFRSPLSRPDKESRRPPLITRTILPTLAQLEFQGVSEYLEDFTARIDTPLLGSISITFRFFHQSAFDVPELAQFIRRTTRMEAINEAHVDFSHYGVVVESLPPTLTFDEKPGFRISCEDADLDPSSLARVFTSLFPSVYIVEHLYIYGSEYLQRQDDIENMRWLEIFQPFTAVKSLYVSEEFTQYIAPAMQELRERATDVLPALESLFLEEPQASDTLQEAFGQFVAARQLLGHPVAVSHWDRT